MKSFLALILFVVPFILFAQIEDNFSDGNINSNPTWLGDNPNFIVNSDFQLQLNAPEEGISSLYISNDFTDSTVWEFYFNLDFNPSGSNNLRIALQSSESDFLSPTNNGYFLFLGETGSEDAINFSRIDNGVETILATASLGAVATGPEVRLRIERTSDATWTFLSDYTGGFNFSEEFQIVDNTYLSGNYLFGFLCEYTESRKDLFFFDDIYVDELLPDSEAPVLIGVEIISDTEVDVIFSEILDEVSATEVTNYSLSSAIGNPSSTYVHDDEENKVRLFLSTQLQSPSDYTLTTQNIADLNGNISGLQTIEFSYLEVVAAQPFEILINEFMADPNPAIGLPEAEFIELYNRTEKIFDLANYGLSTGGAPQNLPSVLLFPGEYIIVCDEDFESDFLPFGNVVTLSSFPALSNNGDEIILVRLDGEITHGVSYTSTTYGDNIKAQGGWSIELENPSSPCSISTGYRAAENLIGGTPGQANSILENIPDEKGPTISRVFATENFVEVYFDEYVIKSAAEFIAYYEISNGVNIISATVISQSNDVVLLELSSPLENNIAYELTISDGLVDCLRNNSEPQSITFALPEKIEEGDLIINEILFDPPANGGDFLEIYNPSEKILNLGDLIIGRIREGLDTTLIPVFEDRLIFPGEYAVFTSSESFVTEFFENRNPEFILQNTLPPFNADEGNVTLLAQVDTSIILVDDFDYNVDMHAPLLDETKGVSLERIDPNSSTNNASNWHSAATPMGNFLGYGTPTFLNSQFLLSGNSGGDDFFEIPEKKLSPDGDGFQDFLVINYRTDQTGYSIRAEIFDVEGRPVKTLFNNELLPTEGFFRWDGETDRGDKARVGIYILWIQLFHPDGTVREFKETCVVAR